MDPRFLLLSGLSPAVRRGEPRGWTQSAAGLGSSRGRAGPGGTEPLGVVRFSSDAHLSCLCVAPDRARLGKVPVGSVSLLLCSEPGGAGCAGICGGTSGRERLLLSGPKTPSWAGGSALGGRGCSGCEPGPTPTAVSMGLQHSPSRIYNKGLKPASSIICLPCGQPVPHLGVSPCSLHPVWGTGEQTVVCTPLRGQSPPLSTARQGCHSAAPPKKGHGWDRGSWGRVCVVWDGRYVWDGCVKGWQPVWL